MVPDVPYSIGGANCIEPEAAAAGELTAVRATRLGNLAIFTAQPSQLSKLSRDADDEVRTRSKILSLLCDERLARLVHVSLRGRLRSG